MLKEFSGCLISEAPAGWKSQLYVEDNWRLGTPFSDWLHISDWRAETLWYSHNIHLLTYKYRHSKKGNWNKTYMRNTVEKFRFCHVYQRAVIKNKTFYIHSSENCLCPMVVGMNLNKPGNASQNKCNSKPLCKCFCLLYNIPTVYKNLPGYIRWCQNTSLTQDPPHHHQINWHFKTMG